MIWIMLMVLVALVVLGILVAMMYFYKDKPMPPTDYYTLFIIGLIWIPFGIIQMVTLGPQFGMFFFMGFVFMIVGLMHKDEWKKNHRTFKQLSKKEQKFKMIIILVLGVLLLVGVGAFYLVRILS